MKTTLLALALSVAALPALAADPLTEQIASADLAAVAALQAVGDIVSHSQIAKGAIVAGIGLNAVRTPTAQRAIADMPERRGNR